MRHACLAQRQGGRLQRGTGGHNVIDQHHPLAAQGCRAAGFNGEGAPQVAQALGAGQAALRLGGVQAQQGVEVGFGAYQVPCQQGRLVEAPLAQAFGGQRHRKHAVSRFQRRFHPRRAAHQCGQRLGPARITAKLELRQRIGPGVGVVHCGNAGIKAGRGLDAGAADLYPCRHPQGAALAARGGLGKPRHAGVADALRGPGVAERALAGHLVGPGVETARNPCQARKKHESIYSRGP